MALRAKVKRNLRPLLRFLSLQRTAANDRLLETLDVMAEAFERGKPLPAPTVSTALIPARLKRYLLEPSGAIIRDQTPPSAAPRHRLCTRRPVPGQIPA